MVNDLVWSIDKFGEGCVADEEESVREVKGRTAYNPSTAPRHPCETTEAIPSDLFQICQA